MRVWLTFRGSNLVVGACEGGLTFGGTNLVVGA